MGMMGGVDEREVVARVLAGDRDAFRVLVELHSRSIFKLAYRIMGNDHDADDVVQETFLRAYAKLKDFHFEAGLRSWLYRIASNYCMDLLVKRRQEAAVPMTAEGPDSAPDAVSSEPDPERLALSNEVGRTVDWAMESLSARERTAFVMRHFHGCSIREVGQAMKLSDGSVKQHIFRAVRKIRAAIGPLMMGTAQ